MKNLPDTKTLLQLLQDAKEAEEKAKELYQMGEDFQKEWETKLAVRQKITASRCINQEVKSSKNNDFNH